MRRRSNITTNRRSEGLPVHSAAELIKKTRCFDHLSDKIIIGFLMHHAYRGFRPSKDKFRYAETVTETCPKCKGRGWFGRGRKPCPVCNGAKTITNYIKAHWAMDRCSLHQYNRERVLAGWFLTGEFENFKRKPNVDKVLVTPLMRSIYGAVSMRSKFYPKWVDEIDIGDHPDIPSDEAREKIRDALSFERMTPAKVGYWDINDFHVRDEPLISVPWACQRLARKFGITCPISGEWVRPGDLITASRDNPEGNWAGWLDHRLPCGLGLPPVRSSYIPENTVFVFAITKKTASKISRAEAKWRREFDSRPPGEWLLAELMGQQIPKLARKAA